MGFWPTARRAIAPLIAALAFGPSPAGAEDVERPVIEIPAPRPDPPRPKPKAPVIPQQPQAEKTDIPAGPRFPFGLDGPRRLDLEGGHEFFRPRHPPQVPEAERVGALLDGYQNDLRAADRVRSGKIDPAWLDLTQRIEHYWRPGFEHVRDERIAEVSGRWLADSTYRTLRGWYRDAQRRRKDPFAKPPRVPGDDAAAAGEGMLGWQRDMLNGDGWGNRVVSLVEIRFGATGQADARLVASSGHPLYDGLALQGVQQAIDNTWGDDPPPGPARTLVAMQADYIILPPMPVIGFAFDEMLGGFDPIYPLAKKVRSKAVLVAVYRDPKAQERGAPDGGVEDGADGQAGSTDP